MDIVGILNKVPVSSIFNKSDDDFSDRLNYRYTVVILILFSITITTFQHSADRINCWLPAHFTKNYMEYVQQVCWMTNTYYYHHNENIPRDLAERRKNELKYYQWVGFILLLQAFFFYMPRIFWLTISSRSGIHISDLIEAANSYKAANNFDCRAKYMHYLVQNIDRYVDDPRRHADERFHSKIKRIIAIYVPCFGRYMGNFLTILYFLVKIVYIANIIVQVALISEIFGRSYLNFGGEFFKNVFFGDGWVVESKYFPKVTLCDFLVREVGHPNKSHRYTVQCVLPMNLFSQQIFIIIWVWYVFVFSWNICELVKWIVRVLPWKSSRWITQRIALFNKEVTKRKPPSEKLKHFIEKYLEPDGLFMIRMIANNTSDFVATDLICELWKKHYEIYENVFRASEPQNDEGIELPSPNLRRNKHPRDNLQVQNDEYELI